MADLAVLVANIVKLAGGEITGRVRLQKIAYLLKALGDFDQNIPFRYHHYGPYSRALDDGIDVAKALYGIKEDIEYRHIDGMPFSIFRTSETANIPQIPDRIAQDILHKLKSQPSTILELAATIHWLATQEQVNDWRSETVKRKGAKTDGGRLDRAKSLLDQLGIAPASQ